MNHWERGIFVRNWFVERLLINNTTRKTAHYTKRTWWGVTHLNIATVVFHWNECVYFQHQFKKPFSFSLSFVSCWICVLVSSVSCGVCVLIVSLWNNFDHLLIVILWLDQNPMTKHKLLLHAESNRLININTYGY